MELQKSALFFYNFLNIFSHIFCTFNVEEMKWVNYDVDILVTPVEKEEISNSIMHITSKSGQEFQCSLPVLNQDDISEKEVVNEREQDVLDLLKPMQSSSCLTKGKDWWTYEFCYGHYIKQYHVEDGHIIGPVLTLGLFESDFDWNNETNQEKFKHTKQKYHSQYYINGTNCDLTGKPRNAEVRIYCEEDVGDFIYRVDEPGTCSYIITVHTSRLCSHPQLKPLPSNKAHLISCNPLLNDVQYSIYLQRLKNEKAMAEEKRIKWLSTQQERLLSLKNGNGLSGAIDKLKTSFSQGKIFSIKNDELQNFIKDIQEAREAYDPKYDLTKDVNAFKSVYTSALNKLLEKFLEMEQEVIQARKELKISKTLVSDGKFLDKEEFKTSLTPEKFALLKNEFHILDDILRKVGEDSDSKYDRTKDNSQTKINLALNILTEKLDKAEKDIVKSIKRINEVKSLFSEGKYGGSVNDIFTNMKKKKEIKIVEETLNVINNEQDVQTRSAELDDDKLQVRIRRLDRRSSDSSGKLHEMDFEQRKKLEQAVKEKLEKAGLDTGGRRIEVKIITAGYYDNEDGKDFQSLTDEETDQFQNMIMALLTGQQEAVQEMKRHKKLEDSYKFIWDDDEEIDGQEE